MSKYYVDLIAQTLRDVHSKIDPDFLTQVNSNFPDWDWDKYYEYQAFQGLDGTPEYDEHVSNSDYTYFSNIYLISANNDSTEIPVCDE